MITEIHIENYKSIDKLTLDLGRINVFIGENGAGKSNILEVIALAGAAAADKLDNEFLVSRGIRVTAPEFMRAAFDGFDPLKEISISIHDTGGANYPFKLKNSNQAYSKWISDNSSNPLFDLKDIKIKEILSKLDEPDEKELLPRPKYKDSFSQLLKNWRPGI